jgi:GTP-binding protein YchF
VDVAIVGLDGSGKTTAFNALAGGHGSTGSGAEHIAVVRLRDERLEQLGALTGAKKVTPLEITLRDLPPLFERGASPSGDAAETLARADVFLHVVRAFERADVPHPKGSIDPQRDIQAFEEELALNDLAIIERRLEKLDITVRSARPGEREAGEREKELLERCRTLMNEGPGLRDAILDPQDLKTLANYSLLSLKPQLIVANIGEEDVFRAAALETEYAERYNASRTAAGVLCAKLEAELSELPPEDAVEFRREMAAPEGAVPGLLRRILDLLGLVTFFTTGDKEARAWAVPAGTSTLQAAGRIHTDMERGFIRAEVIPWERLLELGSFQEAKRSGELRTEGKQYGVREGDVLHVLFNV